jgi:hypothetical protein
MARISKTVQTEKKKARKPAKKKIFADPLQVDWQYAHNIIAEKDETISDLQAKLDIAYREQEQMLKELKRWLDAFPYAFKQLEEHAGKITSEDVTYHANLIFKIMEHKFGYKPKMTEL